MSRLLSGSKLSLIVSVSDWCVWPVMDWCLGWMLCDIYVVSFYRGGKAESNGCSAGETSCQTQCIATMAGDLQGGASGHGEKKNILILRERGISCMNLFSTTGLHECLRHIINAHPQGSRAWRNKSCLLSKLCVFFLFFFRKNVG